MSHDAISQLWTNLHELNSLSSALRDIVGNFTLQVQRSDYHPFETPQRFLQYALELNVTFDIIRYVGVTDLKVLPSLEADFVSSIAHFLTQIAIDFGGSRCLLTDAAYIQIIGQTIAAGICSLRLFALKDRPDLKQFLYRAARKLLTIAPPTDIRLRFIQTLLHHLCSDYGPEKSMPNESDTSSIDWELLLKVVSTLQP